MLIQFTFTSTSVRGGLTSLYISNPLIIYTTHTHTGSSSTHLNFDLTNVLGHDNVAQSAYISRRKFSKHTAKHKVCLWPTAHEKNSLRKNVPRRIQTWRGQSGLPWCVSQCLCSSPAIQSKPGTSSPPGPVTTRWVAPPVCCPVSGGRRTSGGPSPKRHWWTAGRHQVTTWFQRLTGRYPSSKAWWVQFIYYKPYSCLKGFLYF